MGKQKSLITLRQTVKILSSLIWILLFIFMGEKANCLEILPLSKNLLDATIGIPYFQTFSLDQSLPTSAQVSFSNLTRLPIGLEIQGSRLFGIPIRPGNVTLSLVLIVNNLPINNTNKSYQLNIKGISTNSVLPTTFINIPFTVNISYTGGIPPFVWQQVGSPQWMKFDSSVITGNPNRIGNASFIINLYDAYNNTFSRNWTLITDRNRLILNPLTLSTRKNIPYTTNFSVGGGMPPYTFQYINIPFSSSFNSNSLTFTMNFQGPLTFGIIVTDSTGLKNYFRVTAITIYDGQNLTSYLNNVISSYIDQSSGQKIVIYNIPPSNLISGFSVSPLKTPRLTLNSTVLRANNVFSASNQTFIQKASTINNTVSCPRASSTPAQGTGIISLINYNTSTIQLNTRIILLFQKCTLQAFRGQSKSFQLGNFISYQGAQTLNGILLSSISNTS